MLQEVRKFTNYIKDVYGMDVMHEHLPVRVPPFFRSRYELHRIRLPEGDFTGVFLQTPDNFAPAAFEKHLRQLPADVTRHYVVVSEALPSYVRNRMVKRQIPFVVPNVQLFWPELGIAVRARADRAAIREFKQLGPAAQATLIHAVAGKLKDGMVGREMAAMLGWTPMTMTRVLDELEALGLGRSRRVGRTRKFKFAAKGEALWELAKPYLRNPVLHTHVVPLAAMGGVKRLLAGESALAEMSMLSPPDRTVYAVSGDVWRTLNKEMDRLEFPDDDEVCDLQVWSYEPLDLNRDGCVDPYSLMLSIDPDQDERIGLAIDEVMEAVF